MPELRFENGKMVMDTGYHKDFVVWFKAAIPAADRYYNGISDPHDKTWNVHPRHLALLKEEIRKTFGRCDVIGMPIEQPQEEVVTFTLDYIGNLKEKPSGIPFSSALKDGNRERWATVFPQPVLERWFGFQLAAAVNATSLYTILSIGQEATVEEIKKAYRRAARTYHPDYNKEKDANEQFRLVQSAYETLSNPTLRTKYDVGLAWAATTPAKEDKIPGVLWRPPVRCGIVRARIEQGAMMVIKEILEWNDQINQRGETRVTYWQPGIVDIGTWAEEWKI